MVLTFLKNAFSGKGTGFASILLAFVSTFIVIALYFNQNQFLEAFEAKTYDLRFKSLRGVMPPSPEIGIVAIDNKSINELGRFPWSRGQYVRLLDRLSAAGAKVVLFDVFFSEPESSAIDKSLAAAVKRAGNVGLAVAYDFDENFNVVGSTHTLANIEKNAAGFGHINLTPEDDGVVRRNKMYVEVAGKKMPSLGLKGAMMALGEEEFAAGSYAINLGKRRIPVDASGFMWINFTGPSSHYPVYSFADIVQGRIKPGELKGKILFVGATALGIYDLRVTPFDRNTPGVEVHAAITDNILTGNFIRRTGFEGWLDIALILALGLFTFYLTKRLGFYTAFPVAILLSAAYVWLSYLLFKQGHWVSMIYPPLAVILSLLMGGSFRYLVLERSARELRSIFSSYHSDKLVSRLEEDPEAAKIGGDSKDVTIIFTDIKGFTAFSEKHTPQEVVARLNEYLGEMVQVIEEHDGYVDKFIGDGIMAYWGAPLAQADHARLAIACVLAMNQVMLKLCDKWQTEGVEPFAIRAGIQSGEVVAGNVGLRGKKMEYTVIGDTVNQAARLESSAKYYGVDALVGENTYRRTSDIYRYRELDKIRMVGKQVPVTVYELIEPQTPEKNRLSELFAAVLFVYRACHWEEAAKGFASILAEFPDDRPSQMYLERCQYFKGTPVSENWDGVFNRRGK
ncbi:MAG: adenylate/guanylate cyclase domain-containing protein [Gallionellales bacterium 35-53-114]|jgi:adenylate cyclase|nr:MAG: adenylate/guanylate cyclase domain-containing protein [Gallionellales bacterium 35-53-114]OYZ64337.1 MAG: adenylate/guanylate cyclase domain-containing protein [Gallionellales bacterium 24-53-125]OZB10355.1 MAG: adenylate/guanylate cyclase domain-containing protein [Gallionellales bacterium 39-52-133]HQS56962.1 adenylate/guanylate cyclase domain-containing protein [Gallionellaceae bacterium]HQS75254.1 adenylate/guanylate cyclase domain-containing protein [Gallionellaceae bacterium]